MKSSTQLKDVVEHIISDLTMAHGVFGCHPLPGDPVRVHQTPACVPAVFGYRSGPFDLKPSGGFYWSFSCLLDSLPLCLANNDQHRKHFASWSSFKSSSTQHQRLVPCTPPLAPSTWLAFSHALFLGYCELQDDQFGCLVDQSRDAMIMSDRNHVDVVMLALNFSCLLIRRGEQRWDAPLGCTCWLLSGFEEHYGPWLVVVFDGVDGRMYALSNCPNHLVVMSAIAPISEGFWTAAQDMFQVLASWRY